MRKKILLLFSLFVFVIILNAQGISPVGSGSYTTSFPGKDAGNRNEYPTGTAYLSGNAQGKPVPTNDWWSSLVKDGKANNLFTNIFALTASNKGLGVSYVPRGANADYSPITVSVSGLSADKTTVSDYSDWNITMDWANQFQANVGVSMPFIYFTKNTTGQAEVKFELAQFVQIKNEIIVGVNLYNKSSYAVFAPKGSTWIKDGNTFKSDLNGKNYWSIAMLPLGIADNDYQTAIQEAEKLQKYAYVFPVKTEVAWDYNESISTLKTDFTVTVDVKEGSNDKMLMGLMPHHWAHLASSSIQPMTNWGFRSIRGDIKYIESNRFTVENKFYGILPTLPYMAPIEKGFSAQNLYDKIVAERGKALSTWTDSYNEGQDMNYLIQIARIADQMGFNETVHKIVNTIKYRLENWLTAKDGEVSFLFYYNKDWSALIGYPAGHGQDKNLNDHHFHWGYFIHAASFLEQYEPGWASKWGDMVNMLVRDSSTPDRNDSMFPFLRNFSPFAGHCWANGLALFPQGNDQESSSESMQFHSSLIHWGTVTGNKEIRDLGIYLYTTEQTAIDEYWFDVNKRNFTNKEQYALVSRVWGNDLDNQTFWTQELAASYGIEFYPIHGGALYLGHNKEYVTRLWNEIEKNTGILQKTTNPNLWYDVFWDYLAFINPGKALDMYNSYPDRDIKFGISDTHTYYWLHAMNALGQVDATVTANYPIATVFNKNGSKTYVAHNYGKQDLTVSFSDGATLLVPAGKTMTSKGAIQLPNIVDKLPVYAIPGQIRAENFYIGEGVGTEITKDEGGGKNVGWIEKGSIMSYRVNVNKTGVYKINFRVASSKTGKMALYTGDNETELDIFSLTTPTGDWQVWQTYSLDNVPLTEGEQILKFVCLEGGFNVNWFDFILTSEEADEEIPSGLSVSLGTVGSSSAELLLNATDNSGKVVYSISYNGKEQTVSGNSGVQQAVVISNLTAETQYTFSVVAKDLSGNASEPINLAVKTLASGGVDPTPGGCSGTSKEATEGSFQTGYSYSFVTEGNNVTVVFELLDKKDGLAGYIHDWTTGGLQEKVGNTQGNKVSYTFPNQTAGKELKVACKFAFAGGLATTKAFSYIVGDNCGGSVSDTQAPTNVTAVAGNITANSIQLLINATDNSGQVTYTVTYNGIVKTINGASGVQQSILIDNLLADTQYAFSVVAKDASGNAAQAIQVNARTLTSGGGSTNPGGCSGTSKEATEGSFQTGYSYSFVTEGNNVTVVFELLDKKDGLVGYIHDWTTGGLQEKVGNTQGNKVSYTFPNQTAGKELKVACKFAFAGGLATTKAFSYIVGDNCGGSVSDTQAPTNLTAVASNVTANSIQLLLNAADNSGSVVYTISYDGIVKTINGSSGVQQSVLIDNLSADTQYAISVVAKDASGNAAQAVQVSARTLSSGGGSTNPGGCSGTSKEAVEGLFQTGYTYNFVTEGNNVTVVFELLDNRDGLVGYIHDWTTGGLQERVGNTQGNKVSYTFPNQTIGKELKVGCKFAFAGGLSTTKAFSYIVGSNCSGTRSLSQSYTIPTVNIYPTVVESQLTVESELPMQRIEIYNLYSTKVYSQKVSGTQAYLELSGLSTGTYVIRLIMTDNTVSSQRFIKK